MDFLDKSSQPYPFSALKCASLSRHRPSPPLATAICVPPSYRPSSPKLYRFERAHVSPGHIAPLCSAPLPHRVSPPQKIMQICFRVRRLRWYLGTSYGGDWDVPNQRSKSGNCGFVKMIVSICAQITFVILILQAEQSHICTSCLQTVC